MFKEERFKKGHTYFDEGKYFEAHEEWESIWMELSGEERAFIQGLIQISVALYHATRENWKGTRKLFASALDYLKKGESVSGPIDVKSLVDKVLEFEIALQKKIKGEEIELPFFKLPEK